jgi:hypothetical protein
MNGNQRPLSVTILASAYIAVSAVGSVYHFSELRASPSHGFSPPEKCRVPHPFAFCVWRAALGI